MPARFIIALLLAAALVNASPAPVQKESSILGSIGKALREFSDNIWSSASREAVEASTWLCPTKRSAEIGAQRGRNLDGMSKGCVTIEECKNKKFICMKKCYESLGGSEKKHGLLKCVAKCKKCVPTC